jgi:hypothetical protein
MKKVRAYDPEEGGPPAPPAFRPDASGFHPLSGPSKRLDPAAVAPLESEPPATIPENAATTNGGLAPAAKSGPFSPLMNSLNLQGNHPTRR